MKLLRVIPVVVVFVLAVPAAALACPVCGAFGSSDNAWAYAAMTAVLSGLPLAMIGGVVLWVHRRASAGHGELDTLQAPTSARTDTEKKGE